MIWWSKLVATGLDLTISTEGIVKIFRQRYPYPYSCPYPTMPPPMCYAPQPAMMLPPTENNTKTKELEETTQNMKEQHRKVTLHILHNRIWFP